MVDVGSQGVNFGDGYLNLEFQETQLRRYNKLQVHVHLRIIPSYSALKSSTSRPIRISDISHMHFQIIVTHDSIHLKAFQVRPRRNRDKRARTSTASALSEIWRQLASGFPRREKLILNRALTLSGSTTLDIRCCIARYK